MANLLVLDGHSAAALAITRSAGRAGHWVAVGANRGSFATAKLSRYCNATLDYPVSTQDPDAFVDAIFNFVETHPIDLVVPVTDWTLGPLSAQRDRFRGICRLALPSQNALEITSDKYRTIKVAQAVGITVPNTLLVESITELSSWKEEQFPVVVKDRISVRWTQNGAVPGSVRYAYTAAELETQVADRLHTAGDTLIQEFIFGVGIGFACFVADGKVFSPFAWKRVREVDPRGSASSARKSISLDPSLFSLSTRVITEIQFEGIAMVEYKQTPDGRLALMEINGRPWGSIGLPIACGVDYPRYLIEWYLQGKLPPEKIRYRENILCRRVIGELTHLTNLRAGRPPNWPAAYPSYWSTLLTMALPWRPGMCYDDVWLSDPRPGIAAITNWFRSRLIKKSSN